MTAIVALLHDGGCIVAADSAVTSADARVIDRRKVRSVGSLLVGAAGPCRETDMAFNCSPSAYRRGPLLLWCSKVYYPAFLRAVRDETGAPPQGADLLVASSREIVGIDSDGACYEWPSGWGAVGVGGVAAMAYLIATRQRRMTPRKRVEGALRCAAELCGSVSAPWVVQELTR